ncbi:MAG: hypothetical protein JSW54_02845, partial [Fidelibacterota bacterium]
MNTWLKANLCAIAALFLFGSVAYSADVTMVTDKVPRGAYLNGSDGDHPFIQVIKIANFSGTWIAGEKIQITLPSQIDVADFLGNGNHEEDVILTWTAAGGESWALDATTDADKIVVNLVGAAAAPASVLYVVFPVTTDTSSAITTVNYSIDYQNVAANESNDPTTKAVTFSDTLTYITWSTLFDDDADPTVGIVQTDTKGKYYPATAAAAAAFIAAPGLPNFVVDNLSGAVAAANNWLGLAVLWATDVNDDNDTRYTLWASQTPDLTRINLSTGERPLDVIGGADVEPEEYNKDFDTNDFWNLGADLALHPGQLGSYDLDEDYWFFYVTSSATGDWVLGRSDSIDVRHWPTFNTTAADDGGGYDFDLDNAYTPGGGADNVDVIVESGGTIGQDVPQALAVPVTNPNMSSLEYFWDFEDVDNNAGLDIFLSTDDDLTENDLVVTGDPGSEVVDSVGANSIKITTSSIPEEGPVDSYTHNIYTSAADYVDAGDYYVYMVANDGTNQTVYQLENFAGTEKTVYIKHYPYFKFDDVYNNLATPNVNPTNLETGTDDYYVISWGETPLSGVGDGDADADGNATITFYYTAYNTANQGLDDIVTDAAVVSVLDGNLLTDAIWTANVTQIGSTTENGDTKADNRYMWNIGAAGLTAGTDYFIIAHIQENSDHLFVQYTDNGGPIEADGAGAIAADREVVVTHSAYFRAETPLEGEVIVLEGSDETIINWSGFDRDAATDGIVQVFIAPAGTDVPTAIGGAGDWTALAALDGAASPTVNDWYWLFPTGDGGITSSGAGNGPTITSGAFTLDVSDIIDDMDESPGTDARPKGFYDVYYFTTYAAALAAETPVKADGVIRFTGSTAAATNFSLTPNATVVTKGETITVSVVARSASALFVRLLSIAIDVPSTYFTVVDQGGGAPFIDESGNFSGTSVLKNSMADVGGNWQLDFIEVDDSPGEALNAVDLTVAQFQVTVNSSGSGPDLIDNLIQFINTETRVTGIVDQNGNDEVLSIADPAANLQ